LLTDLLAETVGEKSPPGVVQVERASRPQKVSSQVALPRVAGAPPPPGSPELDVPSPQLRRTRWSSIVAAPKGLEREQLRVRVAAVTVALAGMAERSKATRPRRRRPPLLVRPTYMWGPAPSLRAPVELSKSVLSLLAVTVRVAAGAGTAASATRPSASA
jgi:hypothetical protein